MIVNDGGSNRPRPTSTTSSSPAPRPPAPRPPPRREPDRYEPPRPPPVVTAPPQPPPQPPAPPPRPSLFGAIGNFVQNTVQNVQNTVANAVQTVQNTAAHTVQAIQNTAAQTVQTVQNTAAQTVQTVQNTAANVRDELADRAALARERLADRAAQTVNQVNTSVSSFVQRTEQKVKDAAERLPGQLEQAKQDTWAFMNKDLTEYVTVDNALNVVDALNGSAPRPELTAQQQQFVDDANRIMNAPLHELITYDNVLNAVDAVNGAAPRPELSQDAENVVRFGVGVGLAVGDTLEGLASLPELGNQLGAATHDFMQNVTAQGPEGDAYRQQVLKDVDAFLGTPIQDVGAGVVNFLDQAFIQPIRDVQQTHGNAEAAGYAVAQLVDIATSAIDNLATRGSVKLADDVAPLVDNVADDVAETVAKNADELAPVADDVAETVAKNADDVAPVADEVAAVADDVAPAAGAVTPSLVNQAQQVADDVSRRVLRAWGDATGSLGLTPDLKPLPDSALSVTFEDMARYRNQVNELMQSTGAWSDMKLSGWKEKLYSFGGNMDRYRDKVVHVFVGEDGLRTWGGWNPELRRVEPSLNTTARELEVARQIQFHGPGVKPVGDGTYAVQTHFIPKDMPRVEAAVQAVEEAVAPVQQAAEEWIQLGLGLLD